MVLHFFARMPSKYQVHIMVTKSGRVYPAEFFNWENPFSEKKDYNLAPPLPQIIPLRSRAAAAASAFLPNPTPPRLFSPIVYTKVPHTDWKKGGPSTHKVSNFDSSAPLLFGDPAWTNLARTKGEHNQLRLQEGRTQCVVIDIQRNRKLTR